ncbi:hypothetical protein A3E76_05805 [Candidatus Saccharibacteria bacterium RIFCSPHIGHO2_12_FULL_44_22]|nr:MAG: hypothetical protein A3E76_05805 [Candidatus Saccharibacteria bacterium RIFCSPHIGHO2_12_FULL_44_22]
MREVYPNAEFTTRESLDISSDISNAREWSEYSVIINAAAYTSVDMAETSKGRITAWQVNAVATASLCRIALQYAITIVNISSDYVFDGAQKLHSEDELFSPLGVYGQTKAAGDIVVSTIARHYIIRTSWVVGDGTNFVRTMQSLAEKNIKPSVVNDQIGRLTFTSDIAKSIQYLLDTSSPYGTYNVTNEGESVSWADLAKEIYILCGRSSDDVTPVTTAQYYNGKTGIAPRPLHSTLNLAKIKATGFNPRNWKEALREYLVN